jgi:hypothetical protein
MESIFCSEEENSYFSAASRVPVAIFKEVSNDKSSCGRVGHD